VSTLHNDSFEAAKDFEHTENILKALDFETAPDWLLAKVTTGETLWDTRFPGRLLLVRVCRTCQCASASCICDAPVIDAIPVWRRGQGANEKLARYLGVKKEVHTAEKSLPSFKPYTAAEMARRITLWSPVKGVPSRHPAAVYMRKLFAEGDRVLVQLIHATETYIRVDDTFYNSRDTGDVRIYTSSKGSVTVTLVASTNEKGEESKQFYVGQRRDKESIVSPSSSTREYEQIAKQLNADGLATRSGGTWFAATVRKIVIAQQAQ
jgi:hypothetical protein